MSVCEHTEMSLTFSRFLLHNTARITVLENTTGVIITTIRYQSIDESRLKSDYFEVVRSLRTEGCFDSVLDFQLIAGCSFDPSHSTAHQG